MFPFIQNFILPRSTHHTDMVAFYVQEQQVSFLGNSQGLDHGVLKDHLEA